MYSLCLPPSINDLLQFSTCQVHYLHCAQIMYGLFCELAGKRSASYGLEELVCIIRCIWMCHLCGVVCNVVVWSVHARCSTFFFHEPGAVLSTQVLLGWKNYMMPLTLTIIAPIDLRTTDKRGLLQSFNAWGLRCMVVTCCYHWNGSTEFTREHLPTYQKRNLTLVPNRSQHRVGEKKRKNSRRPLSGQKQPSSYLESVWYWIPVHRPSPGTRCHIIQ